MIQQQAFIGARTMLKGALHCHTTRSDGRVEPDAVIRLHYEHGYDFLAITDHRIYNYRNFAPEVPITIIPGMEFDNTFERTGSRFRCFHTVCLGPAKEDGNGYEQDQTFESGTAKNQVEYQSYLDGIHANNNLTIYCHPQWSGTQARHFDQMKGNFAMEIWNTGCALAYDMDRDAAYWDELLGQGQVIYGVATDDGHLQREHCVGWVMVNAENNINSILDSLKRGAFYSSCGPEIYNFYVKDDVVYVDCSPAAKIRMNSDGHPSPMVKQEDGMLTHAEFRLKGNGAADYPYVRITVVDKEGRYAWTNPIFLG